MFTQLEIREIIGKAIDLLFKYDDILLNPEYNLTERSISHRLAIHIQTILDNPELDVDIEYNRMKEEYGNGTDVGNAIAKRFNWEKAGEGSSFVYPDIIIHKRNTHHNYVEIEIKMAWKNGKKRFDYQKINEYISQLNYEHGIYIELSDKREECLIEFGPFNLSAE